MENTVERANGEAASINGSGGELPLAKGTKKSAKLLNTSSIPAKKPRIQFKRHFTTAGSQPLDSVRYVKSSSKIKDTEGRTVFQMQDVEVPQAWSQLAIDIL